MGLTIAFWILAILTVLSAIGVMVQKNVFRAALALIFCLASVAGIFVILSADFLAAAQILVYVGAISVVIILAIMLTREFTTGNPSNRLRFPALIISAALFGLITFASPPKDITHDKTSASEEAEKARRTFPFSIVRSF